MSRHSWRSVLLGLALAAVPGATLSLHSAAAQPLQTAPQSAAAIEAHAVEALAAGHPGEAAAILRAGVAVHPQSAALHARLGYVYRYGGRLADSIAAYRQAQALDSTPAGLVGTEGQIAKALIYQSDYMGAIAAHAAIAGHLRAQGRAPDEKIYLYEGIARLFAGQPAIAVRSFDAARATDPDSLWTQFADGYRAIALNDQARLRRIADKISQRDDVADGERRYRVAHLYAAAGDARRATMHLQAAIEAGFFATPAFRNDPPLARMRESGAYRDLLALAGQREAEFARQAGLPGASARVVLAIHGGGGVRDRAEMTPEVEAAYRADLSRALTAGHAILASGGTGVAAVEAAIRVMEDSPLFNAGRGASYNRDGIHELDSAIMDGRTLAAGGVGVVQQVKNPISLARMVMERSPHVLIAGEGALRFAREQGAEIVAPHYFHTERKWESLQRRLRNETPYGRTNESDSVTTASRPDTGAYGTVGAVALDQAGNLAAGTSTGGREGKLAGRVGDSPIIGAGTYANNETLAVSSTGLGEHVMRVVGTKTMSDLMEYRGLNIDQATQAVVDRIVAMGGGIGVVAVDRTGAVAMPFAGDGMYRGVIREDGAPRVAIYKD